mmetsp:Transcript_63016/g.130962  ORF Transcript_63016/g.130962 Transcript_63016/m.130962 type:complete len:84 (+) Transcript_63016:103-354(+)
MARKNASAATQGENKKKWQVVAFAVQESTHTASSLVARLSPWSPCIATIAGKRRLEKRRTSTQQSKQAVARQGGAKREEEADE